MSLTHQQVINLRVAYSVMAGVPAVKIDLSTFRSRNDGRSCYSERVSTDKMFNHCGTSGCVGGWLASHPHFTAQGFKYSRGIVPLLRGSIKPVNAALELFGDSSIFRGGPSGIWGKRRALARIRQLLLDNGEISYNRNDELRLEEEAMTS